MRFHSTEGKTCFWTTYLIHQGLRDEEREPIHSSHLPSKEEEMAAVAWGKCPRRKRWERPQLLVGNTALMWGNHPPKQEVNRHAEAILERHRVPVTARCWRQTSTNSVHSHLFWSVSSIKVHVRRDLMIAIILEFKVNVSKLLMFF